MKRRFFFENIRSILSFAIVGTFVSNVLVGLLLFAAGRLGISVRLSVAECLTFGALISATVRKRFFRSGFLCAECIHLSGGPRYVTCVGDGMTGWKWLPKLTLWITSIMFYL